MNQSLEWTLLELLRNPVPTLIHQWNWKSAIFSSLCRAAVFYLANLSSGMDAAVGAMLTEFLYRSVSAGFYGALTQAFRKAEPRWAATLVVLIGVPGVSHAIEFCLHWLRGTPNLRTSILASLVLTLVSTSFNLHAMRRGVLVVGSGGQSLEADLRSLPMTIWTFIVSGFGFGRVRRLEWS
ncbi:MAG: hypothetical protein ABIR70_22420 [Bryobacteraceae bacterium]